MAVGTPRDRTAYLRSELERCLSAITEFPITEMVCGEDAAIVGAWVIGSQMAEYPGEGYDQKKCEAAATLRIEFRVADGENIAELAGRVTQMAERGIRTYQPPATAFEDDIMQVFIRRIDCMACLPSYSENRQSGKVFLPITIDYMQKWKSG